VGGGGRWRRGLCVSLCYVFASLDTLCCAQCVYVCVCVCVCVCVEKKSLRRIMYAAARSPKPRVSVHLVFNCYKLSHLTPSSLPSTTGLERSLHRQRPDSKLRTNIGFWNQDP